MARKLTQEEFIARAKEKHGEGRYDYSMVKYVNSSTKVTLKCNKCGYIFDQVANEHLQGKGCHRCAGNMPITKEEFLRRSTEVHHGFYDYSKVNFIDRRTKVIIICPEHGEFKQTPANHMKGCGCWKCYNKRTSERLFYGKEKFIELARKKHGDKYDYSKVVYVDSKVKVTITCPVHGDFEQLPSEHIMGKGCEKCAIEYRAQLRTKDTEWFITKAREIHGDKYTYERSVYTGSKDPIIVTCPTHGDWETTPNTILDKHGCPKCKGEECTERQLKDAAQFLEDVKKVHGDFYDYSKTVYTGSKNKIIVTCPTHGDFEIMAADHLAGAGCAKCYASRGERRVRLCLESLGIDFVEQKRYDSPLAPGARKVFYIDFFIPEKNLAVEYHGDQHYEPVKMFGGAKQLKKQQQRDAALREFCKQQGIRLLEIPYTDFDRIEEILEQELKL
jgi:hypothetical protein